MDIKYLLKEYINTNLEKEKSFSMKVTSFERCAKYCEDVSIDDFSIIAPNAVILGRCKIGRETYIGGNATILPNVSVGDGCIIGAAAVVTKNIKNGLKVCGNPAKEMK